MGKYKYIFKAVGGYIKITKRDNSSGLEYIHSYPAGVYSIIPHISQDGRVCMIRTLRTADERSLSAIEDELQFYYTDIETPSATSVNEAVSLLTNIFAGTSEINNFLSGYETETLSLLNSINNSMKELVFFIKAIAE